MLSLINRDAPGALPVDVLSLLKRFNLTAASLLTSDRQSPKLRHGRALARAVVLYGLPARSLGAAITPENSAGGPRSYIPELHQLAIREGLVSAAMAYQGCPWMTQGCGGTGGGCLAFSGRAGMGSPEKNTILSARGRRTLARLADPAAFGRAVFYSVLRHLLSARRDGLPLAVRLRGLDDYGFHLHPVEISSSEAVAIRHRYGVDVVPGVATMAARLAAVEELRPYEYSKAPTHGAHGLISQRAAGVDVTASLAADRDTAVADAVAALREGFRLAVPVRVPRGGALPTALTLSYAGESVTVPTVDGDASDHRWNDAHGVAVMLRTKRSVGRDPAVADRFSLAAHGLPQHLADGTVQLVWPD